MTHPLAGSTFFQRGALAHTGLTLPATIQVGLGHPLEINTDFPLYVCVQDESGMSRQVWVKKNEMKMRGETTFFFFFSYDSEIIVNKYRDDGKLLEEIFFL